HFGLLLAPLVQLLFNLLAGLSAGVHLGAGQAGGHVERGEVERGEQLSDGRHQWLSFSGGIAGGGCGGRVRLVGGVGGRRGSRLVTAFAEHNTRSNRTQRTGSEATK